MHRVQRVVHASCLLAAFAVMGCSLVVDFDRSRIPSGDAQVDAGPDAGDAGGGCGDGTVDAGEDCDDGNTIDDDGCTSTCQFTCEGDGDCDDGNVCNGGESCNTTVHVCGSGTAPVDGTDCGTTGMVCFGGDCITPMCGNNTVEPGEQCDDGMNGDDADGCRDDCTLSCENDDDCNSLDGLCTSGMCVGDACVSTNINEGGGCDDTNACTSGTTCALGVCGGGTPTVCSGATFCSDRVCNTTTATCARRERPAPRDPAPAARR